MEEKQFIIRVAQGIYVLPKESKQIGMLMPTAEEVAEAIAKRDKIRTLPTGRYVGTAEIEDDGIPYEEKVAAISENLKGYFEKSIELQMRIKTNLLKVGIEI